MDCSYKCPVCTGKLSSQLGTATHPGDEKYGVTLYCANTACPAQEVSGHGNTEKDAFSVITLKFKN